MQAMKVILAVFLGILLFAWLSVVGVILTLNQTLLNADFVVSQVDRLDITEAASEVITDDVLTSMIGADLPIDTGFILPVLWETLDKAEPWVKEQAAAAVHVVYDYVQGRSDVLSFDLTLGNLRGALETNLNEFLAGDLPAELLESVPQLAELTPAQQQALVAQLMPTLMSQIPETLTVDLADISPGAVTTLNEARRYMGYVNLAFWVSIGLAVLFALLIVLVFRSVRGAGITLGAVCLIFGAGMLAIRFTTDLTLLPFLSPYLMLPADSAALTEWAIALLYDVLGPVLWLGIGFAAAGLVLVVGGALAPRRDDY